MERSEHSMFRIFGISGIAVEFVQGIHDIRTIHTTYARPLNHEDILHKMTPLIRLRVVRDFSYAAYCGYDNRL